MKAITNGKLWTITQGVIENGTILIEDGKISAIGTVEEIKIPECAEVIDAGGGHVTPGLIDCHCHLGLFGEPGTMPGLQPDLNEMTDPATPHIRGLDALNPQSPNIPKIREAGFTTVYTGPGSGNVIGGTGLSVKLRGITAEEMMIPGSQQMKFALGENPKRCYGLEKKAPFTRMATAAIFRQYILKAKEYGEKMKSDKKPDYDMKLEALQSVVNGTMKCRIHAHRADDIITAIRLCEEFGLDFAIEHATESYIVKDVLAQKKVTCVLGPMLLGPVKSEVWHLKQETPGILEEAGVNFCITADADLGTMWLPNTLGLLMRRGLSEDMAFKSVTINAATLLGLQDRIGSLEVGKDADISLFDGHPFSNMTLCRLTMIEGTIYNNTL